MDGGSAEDKPCDRDSMEIFSAGTSELGMNKLCGKNENQHIYIPVESVQVLCNKVNYFVSVWEDSCIEVTDIF